MSADLLREAAALMRERAGVACASAQYGWRLRDGHTVVGNGTKIASVHHGQGHESGEHIASWHPAVALAVADWLEASADVVEAEDRDRCGPGLGTRRALAVARAYLGRSS